jgi:SNF2 family DNA or RNA helicase
MTRMLDILEIFLNLHGYTYVRLDGSTKVEVRQQIVDRFNTDNKVFCFISSTRSGGIGLNLTGADSIVFYDTDWNPAMDKQAQDRCHRIGQTRTVHIYRLITTSTIEENIFKKSIQKRELNYVIMEDGRFDTDYFQKVKVRG